MYYYVIIYLYLKIIAIYNIKQGLTFNTIGSNFEENLKKDDFKSNSDYCLATAVGKAESCKYLMKVLIFLSTADLVPRVVIYLFIPVKYIIYEI